METEARATQLLGDHLQGERIVCAIVADTRRWYTPFMKYNEGQRIWYVVLTDQRLLIIEMRNDWRSTRNLDANRRDVDVERFVRTGLGSWWLVLNATTEGRWSLHGAAWTTGFGTPRKARAIAEALGWKPRRERGNVLTP